MPQEPIEDELGKSWDDFMNSIDLTDLSYFAGYKAGARAAFACGCALNEEAMSLVALVQYQKQSQTVHLDPTKWIRAWIEGYAQNQLPTIVVISLLARKETRDDFN